MCGRYTLTDPGELVEELGAEGDGDELEPRYNVAPTQDVPAVVLDEEGKRRLAPLRWGLIPFWAKDEKIGSRMINARSETVAEKNAFRDAFRKRRCLVLADGFYEWKKENGAKQPYYVHLADHEPFTFAGLWERWDQKGERDEPIWSCTILTGPPNDKVKELHDRMPVILRGDARDLWLDHHAEGDAVQEILGPVPAEETDFYPVSRLVNSPKNDVPACVERVA